MDETIDIEYLAQLARLDLPESDQAAFTSTLKSTLAHFEALKRIDTDAVEPTAHSFEVFNVFRKDEPGGNFTPEEALANTAKQKDNHFMVPKVVE